MKTRKAIFRRQHPRRQHTTKATINLQGDNYGLVVAINNGNIGDIRTSWDCIIAHTQTPRPCDGLRVAYERLFDQPMMKAWIHEDGSCPWLWLHGKPGAGKSWALSAVIRVLRKLCKHEELIMDAFVYCTDDAGKILEDEQIFRLLCRQLVSKAPLQFDQVQRYHARAEHLPMDCVWDLIKEVIDLSKLTYIVIDGFDECERRSRLKILKGLRLLHGLNSRVRVLVSSRTQSTSDLPFHDFYLQAHSSDMINWLHSELKDIPFFRFANAEDRQFLAKSIAAKADGIFLFAEICARTLSSDVGDLEEAKQTVREVPKGQLSKLVEQSLRAFRSHSPRFHHAIQIHMWITLVFEPLTLDELQHVLGKEFPQEEVLDLTRGFIVFGNEHEDMPHGKSVLRYRHAFFKAFFEEHFARSHHQILADRCRDLILQHESSTRFLQYASRYWGRHARICQESYTDAACIAPLENAYFLMTVCRSLEMSGFHLSRPWESSKLPTAAHVLAGLGLDKMIIHWTNRHGGLNDEDDLGRTPFMWAEGFHQHKTAKFLLSCVGFDISIRDHDGKHGLYYAAQAGDYETLRLLLRRMPKQRRLQYPRLFAGYADAFESAWTTLTPRWAHSDLNKALFAAIESKSSEAVFDLLSFGANPAHIDSLGRNGLHVALQVKTWRPQDTLLVRLVQMGCQIHHLDSTGVAPIHLATIYGSVQVYETLVSAAIANGQITSLCDVVNLPYKDSLLTPLHIAAALGRPELVKLLRSAGASSKAADARGYTALHLAILGSRSGLENQISWIEPHAFIEFRTEFLDPDSEEWEIETQSWETDRMETVREVLRCSDVDLNANSEEGHTALYLLSNRTTLRGSNRLLLLGELLKFGADPCKRDPKGRTSLHWACQSGDLSYVALLSDFGADLYACDKDGRNCAHVAATYPQADVIDWLLNQNGAARLFSQLDREGNLALHLYEPMFDLAPFLLIHDKFGGLEALNHAGQTPFTRIIDRICHGPACFPLDFDGLDQLAERKGGLSIPAFFTEILQRLFSLSCYTMSSENLDSLLGRGVDINSLTAEGQSLLHLGAAASTLDTELVELMWKRGLTHFETKDGAGQRAIDIAREKQRAKEWERMKRRPRNAGEDSQARGYLAILMEDNCGTTLQALEGVEERHAKRTMDRTDLERRHGLCVEGSTT